ncbi:unnamed protein product [Acanthoscelides obtectus]|uniref:Mos1 transposase HTH domain-containing protein n=1 Tax=Acanthoscelides obtectus TaxID=200917 RepID=A0A9P0JT40_ACAOB|nr:unnamed protein product [Acanthoscelides obtectus]CAK1625427.1 Histone-lysine N-methyltransferase SETMAR [Acanthoscelides obtectus]
MELNREHFRAIIYYNFQRKLSQQECLAELLSVFGNEAPHQSTISRWYGEFKRGRVSLSDDPKVGAPKTAVTLENVDAVRKLIIQDKHVTYREIEASLNISKTSIKKNLHEELGVRKLVSRWIPHLLTEEQKAARVNWCQKRLTRQSAVWVFQGEEKLTKVIRSRSVSKKMFVEWIIEHQQMDPDFSSKIILSDEAHFHLDGFVNRQNCRIWAVTFFLPKLNDIDVPNMWFQQDDISRSCDLTPLDFFLWVITEHRKINPERRIILHQDNASSHTAQKTTQYLTEENVELLNHPPYKEAVNAFKNAVLDLPANEWNKCFENWFERMQMCINLRGEYFENNISSKT